MLRKHQRLSRVFVLQLFFLFPICLNPSPLAAQERAQQFLNYANQLADVVVEDELAEQIIARANRLVRRQRQIEGYIQDAEAMERWLKAILRDCERAGAKQCSEDRTRMPSFSFIDENGRFRQAAEAFGGLKDESGQYVSSLNSVKNELERFKGEYRQNIFGETCYIESDIDDYMTIADRLLAATSDPLFRERLNRLNDIGQSISEIWGRLENVLFAPEVLTAERASRRFADTAGGQITGLFIESAKGGGGYLTHLSGLGATVKQFEYIHKKAQGHVAELERLKGDEASDCDRIIAKNVDRMKDKIEKDLKEAAIYLAEGGTFLRPIEQLVGDSNSMGYAERFFTTYDPNCRDLKEAEAIRDDVERYQGEVRKHITRIRQILKTLKADKKMLEEFLIKLQSEEIKLVSAKEPPQIEREFENQSKELDKNIGDLEGASGPGSDTITLPNFQALVPRFARLVGDARVINMDAWIRKATKDCDDACEAPSSGGFDPLAMARVAADCDEDNDLIAGMEGDAQTPGRMPGPDYSQIGRDAAAGFARFAEALENKSALQCYDCGEGGALSSDPCRHAVECGAWGLTRDGMSWEAWPGVLEHEDKIGVIIEPSGQRFWCPESMFDLGSTSRC